MYERVRIAGLTGAADGLGAVKSAWPGVNGVESVEGDLLQMFICPSSSNALQSCKAGTGSRVTYVALILLLHELLHERKRFGSVEGGLLQRPSRAARPNGRPCRWRLCSTSGTDPTATSSSQRAARRCMQESA